MGPIKGANDGPSSPSLTKPSTLFFIPEPSTSSPWSTPPPPDLPFLVLDATAACCFSTRSTHPAAVDFPAPYLRSTLLEAAVTAGASFFSSYAARSCRFPVRFVHIDRYSSTSSSPSTIRSPFLLKNVR